MTIPFLFLLESYDFRVLIRPSRFLLQVTSNKGSNKGKFYFVKFTPEKCLFQCVFAQKLRFFSPYKAIEIPSASYFKYRVKFHFVQLTPENSNSYVLLLKSYDF